MKTDLLTDLYYSQGTSVCRRTSAIGGAVSPSRAMPTWGTARVWPDAPDAEHGVMEPAPVPGHGCGRVRFTRLPLGRAWLSPRRRVCEHTNASLSVSRRSMRGPSAQVGGGPRSSKLARLTEAVPTPETLRATLPRGLLHVGRGPGDPLTLPPDRHMTTKPTEPLLAVRAQGSRLVCAWVSDGNAVPVSAEKVGVWCEKSVKP